jgi:hypothetical protein
MIAIIQAGNPISGKKIAPHGRDRPPYWPIAGRGEGGRDCGKVSFNMKVSPFPFFSLFFFFSSRMQMGSHVK